MTGGTLRRQISTREHRPMWSAAQEDWESWLAASGKPESTRYLRTYQLRRFAAEHADPWAVTSDDLVAWLAVKGWALETRRSYRAALRSFYGWAHRAGRIPADPSLDLPPVRPAVALPRPTPESVLREALVDADERVRCMMLLAARCGLRRAEVAQVHSRDVEEDLLGWSLVVHGKGRRDRRVPLPDEVRFALRRQGEGWAFPGPHGHLGPVRVGELVSEALPEGWTMHTLRHRYATRCYAGSRDLLAVSTLLGHTRPETTRRYVGLSDDSLRSAAQWAA